MSQLSTCTAEYVHGRATEVHVSSPVKQLSSGHQLQHQRDVRVRLEDLLQLDLNHKQTKPSWSSDDVMTDHTSR